MRMGAADGHARPPVDDDSRRRRPTSTVRVLQEKVFMHTIQHRSGHAVPRGQKTRTSIAGRRATGPGVAG